MDSEMMLCVTLCCPHCQQGVDVYFRPPKPGDVTQVNPSCEHCSHIYSVRISMFIPTLQDLEHARRFQVIA
jgi:hypothetical protein